MKIIVTTCDDYMNYLKGFAYLFNKYWPDDAEVTVLGYSVPPFDLPDNFKFVSLGRQAEYGRDWTSALIPFFKQLPDEYFVLLLDDVYIVNVNTVLLYKAEEYMANGADKIFLTYFNGRTEAFGNDPYFDIYKQDARFRLSLQPSFIRKDYFLKHLIPGKTIWGYETNHDVARNDGAKILISKQGVLYYSNFVKKGQVVDVRQIARIKKEDLSVIKRMGVF